jgi:hypothetical protein
VVYFIAGIGLPDDIELVHIARERMLRVIDERSYVLSILDFIERFGANSQKAIEKIGEAEEKRANAVSLFRDMRMTDSLSGLNDALETLDQAYELAMDARDRAMMWIFLVQWLVVTSTGLLCGFILWTVMIKRRLYRDVATTRLG